MVSFMAVYIAVFCCSCLLCSCYWWCLCLLQCRVEILLHHLLHFHFEKVTAELQETPIGLQKMVRMLCYAMHRRIRQMTISSFLTSAHADSARPTQRCVFFDVRTTPSVIGVSQWLDHASGPRCLWTATVQHSWTVQTVAEDTPVPGRRRFVTFCVIKSAV